MELDMVADMEVYKRADNVAYLVADMVTDQKKRKKKVADMELDMVADIEVDLVAGNGIDIDMEMQFGERIGHGVCLIGPKLF